MKKSWTFILVFGLTTAKSLSLLAQDTSTLSNLITADKLASGNYKDVLNSFYQLALNDLTSPEKEISFTSNIYAIRLKTNPDLNIDKNYVKPLTTICRRTNVNWDLKLDSDYKLNGFTAGIKYAVIDRRDYSLSKQLIPDVEKAIAIPDSLQLRLGREVSRIAGNDATKLTALNRQARDYLHGKITYTDLDPSLQTFLIGQFKELLPGVDPKTFVLDTFKNDKYKAIINTYKNKLLWTIAADATTYSNQFYFSNTSISTEALKGIVNPKSLLQLEFDIKATLAFSDDSSNFGNDLLRSVLTGEGGLNLILNPNNASHPLAELKLGAALNDILKGSYLGETGNVFTLDGTLRIHITDDLSIPVTITYDPETANVFGFLNITSNFTWLNKLLLRRE